MTLSLGIHIGHHSSCAVVSDGELLSAIQRERISRKKHDGDEVLTNYVPVDECLRAANVQLEDLDHIITSFQAVSPGGFGLHRPIIAPDFNLFDPYDKRHQVISHHLAHAYCTYGLSGFTNSGIIVCDLAGSSTLDGKDYGCSFDNWIESLSRLDSQSSIKTECLSIYLASSNRVIVKQKEYCIPHNAPESFVQNIASLYENVSYCVFRRPNAYGQLMALSAYANVVDEQCCNVVKEDIISISKEGNIIFKNDWQHKVAFGKKPLMYASLARAVQSATEEALLIYTRRAKCLTKSENLAVAGGIFLNILANSKIYDSRIFKNVFVPSAPHDAGISIGCAYYGDLLSNSSLSRVYKRSSDRLGKSYSRQDILDILKKYDFLLDTSFYDCKLIAERIADGAIVARWAGRSEFGSRALGGRSILASPCLEKTKKRLNKIKKRQSWRPVAPIVVSEKIHDFFSGTQNSKYMSFAHFVKPEYQSVFPALFHPDNTTRVQTLNKEDDSSLYQLLRKF